MIYKIIIMRNCLDEQIRIFCGGPFHTHPDGLAPVGGLVLERAGEQHVRLAHGRQVLAEGGLRQQRRYEALLHRAHLRGQNPKFFDLCYREQY